MRSLIIAVIAATTFALPAGANVITRHFSSFYVFGDSLSDDGNLFGPFWYLATGGDPYQGNWVDGGTFTNGDVWNEPLQNTFRDKDRDADNFAVARARTSGGTWLIPDLDDQIDDLLDNTSSGDRGKNPLFSIWMGGNNVVGAIADGDGVETAVEAAKAVARGIKRLASKTGGKEFLVFNLPDLGKIPEYRLFDRDNRDEAIAAGKAYNSKIANRIRALERDGLNIIDIDIFALFKDVIADPGGYGFSNTRLPCVFPSERKADEYDRPERCSGSEAKKLLFVDGLHPNSLAHSIIGDFVEDSLEADILGRSSVAMAMRAEPAGREPIPNPLPGSATLLAGALAVAAMLRVGQKRTRKVRARVS